MNLPPDWQLPEAITSRLGQGSGRQRAIVEEGHLLLVLHQVPQGTNPERQGAYFWRKPDGEWFGYDGQRGVAALVEHLHRYDVAVDVQEKNYDAAATAREYFDVLEAIVPLHRAASNQYMALQAARECLPDAHELITPRDMAGDVVRAADLVHTDAKNALDFRVAEQAEQQAKAAQRLNLLAAFFLPVSIFGGVIGSSMRNGLENAEPGVFWFLLIVSLTAGWSLYVLMSEKKSR